MPLDLFTMAPSEPDRLAKSLRDGQRLDEFVIALGRFLDQTAFDTGADGDLIYSTAAQLSAAGVFDAVEPAQVAGVFLRASAASRRHFLSGLNDRARAGISKAMREAAATEFAERGGTEVPSRLLEAIKRIQAKVDKQDASGFWAPMRVGRNHTQILKTLSQHNVHPDPFLTQYDTLTKKLRKGTYTCVYFKPERENLKFSILDAGKIVEIDATTPFIDFDDTGSMTAELASNIMGNDSNTSMEAVLRLVSGVEAVEKMRRNPA